MTTDLTLILPDRVGSLAQALGVFAGAGIEIDGCAGFPAWAGEGILHALVREVDAARDALAAAGIVIREEREVLVTRPLEGTAEAARALELIAAANVNIDLIYQLRDRRLVLGVNRLEVAREAVRALGDAAPVA